MKVRDLLEATDDDLIREIKKHALDFPASLSDKHRYAMGDFPPLLIDLRKLKDPKKAAPELHKPLVTMLLKMLKNSLDKSEPSKRNVQTIVDALRKLGMNYPELEAISKSAHKVDVD